MRLYHFDGIYHSTISFVDSEPTIENINHLVDVYGAVEVRSKKDRILYAVRHREVMFGKTYPDIHAYIEILTLS